MKDLKGLTPEIFMTTTNRSAGKTTYFNRMVVNRYKKTGKKFILVYRFNYELVDCANKFFKEIRTLFFPQYNMFSRRKAKGKYHELYIGLNTDEEMEYEFEQRAALCRRYEDGTETNHRPGRGGAEDRGCHGTQLERHDLIPEAASRNPGTDSGASGSVGNRRTANHTDAGADRFSVGASGSRRGCDAEVSGQGGESNNGGGDLDENSSQGNGEALWAAEREIFLRTLRAAEKTGRFLRLGPGSVYYG